MMTEFFNDSAFSECEVYILKDQRVSQELLLVEDLVIKNSNFAKIVNISNINEIENLKSLDKTTLLFFDKYAKLKDMKLTSITNLKTFLIVDKINNDLVALSPNGFIIEPSLNRKDEIFSYLRRKVINFEKIKNFELNYKKIEEQQKKFDNIFELLSNNSLITKTDKSGKIIYANDIFLKTSGYKKHEVIGQKHKIIRHPKTSDKEIQNMWNSISKKEVWSGIVRNISKQGVDFIVESKIIPEVDSNGEIQGFLAVQYDISDLVHKNELSQLLIDEQSNAVFIGQVGKGIISNSKEAEKIFNKNELNLIYSHKKNILDFSTNLYENDQSLIKRFVNHKSVTLQNVNLELQFKEGIYNITQKRIDSPIGKYYFITINDVTTSKKEVAEARLEAAAKSNFLATMSHEIRTPLNGMIPYIDLLLETSNLTYEQLDYISTIKKSSESLLRIIDDILDFSKIESGKLEIEKISFDPIKEFETVIDLYTAKADEKKINLYTYIEPTLPFLIGDPSRIKQIINNLLSNAIKFTPENGEIIFSVEDILKTSDNKVQLYIYIKDNGRGIEKEHQQSIFTPFSQADNSISRKFGGTGLGLSISQNIANLMGGKISLVSKLGKGSKFILNLELDISKEETIKKPLPIKTNHFIGIYLTQKKFKCKAILLAKYLKAMNFNYKIITTYQEAIICDILFIISSGNDDIDFITDDFVKKRRIITIIGSTVENINRFYSHITINMPLNGSKIFDSINDIEKIFQQKEYFLNILNKNVKKYNARVLVAEDNSTNQKLVKTLLAKHKINVEIADNGKIALEKYIDSIKTNTNKYSLIFMDIHMPVMDGIQSVAHIRKFEKENNIKETDIIALTADAIKTHQQQYLENGFNDFLAKPIEKNKFEHILEKYLSNFVIDSSIDISNTELNTVSNRIDNICNNLGLDKDIAEVLLNDFMENWKIFKVKLSNAIANKDYDDIKTISHSLKGAAGSLQLDNIYNICKKLELLAINKSNNQDIQTYKKLFFKLTEELD